MNNIYRIEINFKRLLSKCEELLENNLDDNFWRLEKYILVLEEQFSNLNKSPKKPSIDCLKDYSRRLEFLKNSTKTKKNSDSQEFLTTIFSKRTESTIQKASEPKQIFHKAKMNQESLIREQLFKKSIDNGPKTSKIIAAEASDTNKLIEDEKTNQDKLANEMLKSVKAIKENSILANRIIKSDNKVLDELNLKAEKNVEVLKKTNEHLTNRVSKSCFNCWIWLMIMLILVIFVMMVLFMKLFPKQKFLSEYQKFKQHNHETSTNFLNNNTIYIENKSIHKIEL
jgi:SNARE protein 1